MNAEIILILQYVVLGVLILFGMNIIINLYKNKPTWGQVRIMGIPFVFFLWIQVIFWIVMAESLYSIVSFIANIPIWIDILISIIILGMILIVFFKVSKNTKFNKALFIPVVLIPLGFPGISVVAKAVKLGSMEITKTSGFYIVKNINFLKPNFAKVVKEAPNQIGVYIFRLNGKVVYIGRAIEQRKGQATSGLRKRLQEHYRGSSTGKQELNKYKDKLNVHIIPLKSIDEAKKLEAKLIKKYDTVNQGFNKRYE